MRFGSNRVADPAGRPVRQGLYDPTLEHDACGVGFVANVRGEKSHETIDRGIEILVRLEHRGACGCDPETGDGAGVLIQLPDGFLRKQAATLGIELPPVGEYASGMVFLSGDSAERAWQEATLEKVIADEGQRHLGWRDVPHDPQRVGRLARESLPVIRQIFVAAGPGMDRDGFERKLFVIRRVFENAGRERGSFLYVPSLSSRTFVFTGMLMASQIEPFYTDLGDSSMKSALAMVHARYSTNTFGAWDLAQPFRYLGHNGEINTLRGNRNYMHAREGTQHSDLFGDDLAKLYPLMREGASDSAQFDNALEFLCLAGRELPEAILMMIPEAWENHTAMSDELRAYYEYHSFLMEPWDGPASIAFTDGRKIGAVLDRNGLRPSRWIVTRDGFVAMASEVGVLDIAPENVLRKGRLLPGRIFFVDLEQGRIVEDDEIKADYVARRPYRKWVDENRIRLSDLPRAQVPTEHRIDPDLRFRLQQVFGYTTEDLNLLIAPMITHAKWAIGSMGEDAALACLSDRPRMLYHYFKQLFAQVTNPAMDSINEGNVMSLYSTLGEEKNLLEETAEHARILRCDRPILTNEELERIRGIRRPGFEARTFPTLFKVTEGGEGLRSALDRLSREVADAVAEGVSLIILSDRGVTADLAPIPMLLAVGSVHHHLIREERRTRCGIICETAEARDVSQFALLVGYGAGAINPYLAFETLDELVSENMFDIEEIDFDKALGNYLTACDKGLLKTMAKMGISTLQSYRGAQIFEAVGLDRDLVARCFTGTASRVSGVGYDVLAREVALRHDRAFFGAEYSFPELDPGGLYQWRARGEQHTFNPQSVSKLQQSVRQKDFATYREFSRAADGDAERLCTLRGLLRFKFAPEPIPLEEVEPASEIVKRFCTGAMSYGSISIEAHEALAVAMNRLGGKSNTGEGGEDPGRYTPDPNGDSRRSAIKQVASGRFGVTSWYLINADELQIKVAQGAKPGEGGELPGHKVSEAIAKTRHSTPGVGLISPPPHHDIYSIEDLAQLIYDLKNANRDARVSVKLVAETGVGTIAAGVAKGKADGVLISGHDGGTGASPQASIKSAGVPWEIGLAETQQTLVLNDLRGRIRVQTDGGLKTGRDVAIAALFGADEFGFSTAPLVAMGCILMRVCHLNTCPVGIATQNSELRKRFAGVPDHVVTYLLFVAEELREIMAKLGFRRVTEMIGQVDRLFADRAEGHWKAAGLDFSELLHKPDVPHAVHECEPQGLREELKSVLDMRLLELARPALESGQRVKGDLPIHNTDRTVGAILGSEVSRRYGPEGLPDDTIDIRFTGSAGQSFGAFVPKGITLRVSGDANDYCGKGLSGGRIAIRVPEGSSFDPADNIITGNVVLYGATSGEAYFQGVAGERFCVRNSGADAVVEGVGDHGCEYMTGGRVVILGPTGRNFGAGMSGGIAYVLDLDGAFPARVNRARVDLEVLTEEDEATVLGLVRRHHEFTQSERADSVLREWDRMLPKFAKVFPKDLKVALDARLRARTGDG